MATTIGIPALNVKEPSAEVKKALAEELYKNHHSHHVQFSNYRFANHFTHTILTDYALGASAERIRQLSEEFDRYLDTPVPDSQFTITETNWQDYLGKRHYREYLDFFDQQIQQYGLTATFQKYIPMLLPRTVGHAVHPLITLGFALEFQQPLVLSEGLAYSCIVNTPLAGLITDFVATKNETTTTNSGRSCRDILEAIRIDHQFDDVPSDNTEQLVNMHKGAVIKYALGWMNESDPAKEVDSKLRELTVASVVLYAATYDPSGPILFDFFLMHVLTSRHAVRCLLPYLTLEQRVLALQAHFLTMINYYITRGRPPITTDAVMKYQPKEIIGWEACDKAAVAHSDEHVPKVVRACLKAAEDFGEENDLFLKAAEMTLENVKDSRGWLHSPIGLHRTDSRL